MAPSLSYRGQAPKVKKDPGIPNLHPLKGQLLREAEAMKERREQEVSSDCRAFSHVWPYTTTNRLF
jgi:hypothetical protein